MSMNATAAVASCDKDNALNRPQTLAGKIALVTGAGRGIGKAIAIAFAQAGCSVACVSRTRSEVNAVVQLIRSAGVGEAEAFVCDVGDLAAIPVLAAELRRWIDRPVSILVNNAGVARIGAIEFQRDLGNWNRIMATNLTGPVALVHQFLPDMISPSGDRGAGSGVIISIGSRNAIYPIPFMSAYSVSKTGLLRFHENLDKELRGKGVNIFYAVPGNVETSILDSCEAIDDKSYCLSAGVQRMVTLISTAEKSPSEVVASTCVRLATDKNAGVLSGRYIDLLESYVLNTKTSSFDWRSRKYHRMSLENNGYRLSPT
ncbi:Ketoacyl reductase HetN [Colletotrichum tanaceti]|uniref:Ketoacyl reductase HetN n=1 Tax=Colletotrichum tanaceti TaxID=1306861 RepID=A0A4U6XRE3_9PEZI|nr:Ketoacyl reductase HetN [Colletotrichum tanaceti]